MALFFFVRGGVIVFRFVGLVEKLVFYWVVRFLREELIEYYFF